MKQDPKNASKSDEILAKIIEGKIKKGNERKWKRRKGKMKVNESDKNYRNAKEFN